MRFPRKRVPASMLRQQTARERVLDDAVLGLSDLLYDSNLIGHRILQLLQDGETDKAEVQLTALLAEEVTGKPPRLGRLSVAARQAVFRGERP